MSEHRHEHEAHLDAGEEGDRQEEHVGDDRGEQEEGCRVHMPGPHLEGKEVCQPPDRVIQEYKDAHKKRDLGREPYSPSGRLGACLQRHARILS